MLKAKTTCFPQFFAGALRGLPEFGYQFSNHSYGECWLYDFTSSKQSYRHSRSSLLWLIGCCPHAEWVNGALSILVAGLNAPKESKPISKATDLHVGVDHLLELVGRHLGHGVDEVEELPPHRVVRRLLALQHALNVLQGNVINFSYCDNSAPTITNS